MNDMQSMPPVAHFFLAAIVTFVGMFILVPVFFPAEQNRRLLYNEDGSPTDRAKSILTHTPMNRFGKAEELIGAAVFLAAARASGFVTGSDIRVDGGFLASGVNG